MRQGRAPPRCRVRSDRVCRGNSVSYLALCLDGFSVVELSEHEHACRTAMQIASFTRSRHMPQVAPWGTRPIRIGTSKLNRRKRDQGVGTVLGTRVAGLWPNYSEFGEKTARPNPATIRCFIA